MDTIRSSFTNYLQEKEKNLGFTLVELLVAIGVLSLAMVAGTSLFFMNLRSERKTKSMTIVKQTGSYALEAMSQMIRNARDITSCTSDMDSIEITNPDGQTTTFTCRGSLLGYCSSSVGSERIASYSASTSRIDCLTADDLYLPLTDCQFDCSQTSGEPPIVTINFSLYRGSPTDVLGYAKRDFMTTVSLRTY